MTARRSIRGWPCGLALIALTALAACGTADLLGPDASQGIDGLVLRGPMCPVQPLEDPCPDEPYQAWIGVRNGSGALVTRVRSDEDGRFRVGLRPGVYTLEPESGDPFPVATEQDVIVFAGAFVDVVVNFDTGIR